MLSLLPAAIARALTRFRAGLELRFGQRLLELTLFGSRARGEANEQSDVDVLVVVEGLTESERREVFDLAYDANAAERDIWVGLSAVAFSDTQARDLRARERLLFQEIDREGIPA